MTVSGKLDTIITSIATLICDAGLVCALRGRRLGIFLTRYAPKVRALAIQHGMEAEGKGIAGIARNWWHSGVAGAICMLLAGCAGFPGAGVSADSPQEVKQKVVSERAKARWQVVMQGNVEAAYEFLSPGTKAMYPIAVYGGRARFKDIRSADVQSAECGAETCRVKVKVVIDHKLMKSIPFEVTESWVLENGRYWYVWQP